jgi:hypothetical protein
VIHGQYLEALKVLCDTAGIGLLALR